MTKFILPLTFLLFVSTAVFGLNNIAEPISNPQEDISAMSHALSVSVKMDNSDTSSGSGVVFNNGKHTYIWGCAHVVKPSQNIKKVYDARLGKEVIRITYKDVVISRLMNENGRKVGEIRYIGKVIRYSNREDISLVKLYASGKFSSDVKFSKDIPEQGTSVWCVGSPMGDSGHTSVSKGVMAAIGRLKLFFKHNEEEGIVYDQVAVAATFGNSGGGVFLDKNGECLGLVSEFLVRSDYTPGLFCIVPARRIRAFAERNNCVYALDSSVRVPDNEVVITDDDIELSPAEPRQTIFRFNIQP